MLREYLKKNYNLDENTYRDSEYSLINFYYINKMNVVPFNGGKHLKDNFDLVLDMRTTNDCVY